MSGSRSAPLRVALLSHAFVEDPQAAARVASVRDIGLMLFRDHAFSFEVTSILILVAMVGAVVLAKKTV